jgi:membrane associated rhomboid family serine protease
MFPALTPVVLNLLIINGLVWLLQLALMQTDPQFLQYFVLVKTDFLGLREVLYGQVIPPDGFIMGSGGTGIHLQFQPYQLVTHFFSHSYDSVMHILFNMLALVMLWQAGVMLLGVKEYILPTPLAALRTLADPNYQWTANLLATLYAVLGAFVLSAVLGVALAVVIVWNDLMLRTVMPVLVLFNTLPKIALAPLFVVWLGYGIWPNIVIGTTIAGSAVRPHRAAAWARCWPSTTACRPSGVAATRMGGHSRQSQASAMRWIIARPLLVSAR